MKDTIEQFVKERNEALLSLDETKIREMFIKFNNSALPTNSFTFWGSVHKAITAIPSFPIEFRKSSKEWLTKNGMKSCDDGDL